MKELDIYSSQKIADYILECNVFIDIKCLKKYPDSIKCIPKNDQTQEMVDTILEKGSILLLSSYINPKFIDTERLKKYPKQWRTSYWTKMIRHYYHMSIQN